MSKTNFGQQTDNMKAYFCHQLIIKSRFFHFDLVSFDTLDIFWFNTFVSIFFIAAALSPLHTFGPKSFLIFYSQTVAKGIKGQFDGWRKSSICRSGFELRFRLVAFK